MRALTSYRLRLKRKKLRIRAFRKSFELKKLSKRSVSSQRDEILCFVTLRNELPRLAFFLQYYRNLGVSQFFVVDNGSDDGSMEYLLA
ncbi:MAG: glycosyltransferase family 2 protein, partial [Rhodobacteraceae bacterium]|nr:glycosyltransferase family 2 protein [Paracoccaceae bacterium]